ncbi:MAG: S-layer homology domain-containing protein [Lawsonibacter sp.]
MKKRILSLLLAVILVCSLVPTAFAASSEATDAANALHNLGLFNGTGTNADGTPIYDLDRAPTRHEAVTMLVRLLGKGEEALAGTWETPFTDVAEWAKPYVGYAYANGLTAGTSETTFGGEATVTASQYLTFVLRALGYSSNTDFKWDAAWELSDKIGMTDGRYHMNYSNFSRGDVAIISNSALYAKLADSDKKLIDVFNENGFGVLQQNEKTMKLGGDSQVVKINGKYYGDAYLTTWAYEFNGEISLYTGADSFGLLKTLAQDYTIKESENPALNGVLAYDMTQTSHLGVSQWNAFPTTGVRQNWIEYFYGGTSFAVPVNNNGHDDKVLYCIDGVRCFDRVWNGQQSTYVNVEDLLHKLSLDATIEYEDVAGIGTVWSFK